MSLPHTKYAIATYYLVCTAEASSNLARYDGVRYGYRAPDARSLEELYTRTRGEGFGAEPKRRIMLGTYVLRAGYYEAYYGKALRARRKIADDFTAAFAQLRRDRHADVAGAGVQVRRAHGRSAADVPGRRAAPSAPDLAGVPALSQPLRVHQGRAADRPADDRRRRWARRLLSRRRPPTRRAPKWHEQLPPEAAS